MHLIIHEHHIIILYNPTFRASNYSPLSAADISLPTCAPGMVAVPDESPNLSLSADDISETCSTCAPGMDAAAAAPNFRFSAADIGTPLPPEDDAPNFKLSAANIDVEGCAPGILAALAAPNFKLSAAETSDDVALYAPGLWALAAAAAATGGDFFFPLVEVPGPGPLPNFTRSASEISSFDTATAPTNVSGGDFSFGALALPSIPS